MSEINTPSDFFAKSFGVRRPCSRAHMAWLAPEGRSEDELQAILDSKPVAHCAHEIAEVA